jgi:hypothetical protein
MIYCLPLQPDHFGAHFDKVTKPSHLQLQNDGSSTRNCPSLSLPWNRIIRRYELGSSYIQSNIKGQQDTWIPKEKLKQVPTGY